MKRQKRLDSHEHRGLFSIILHRATARPEQLGAVRDHSTANTGFAFAENYAVNVSAQRRLPTSRETLPASRLTDS